MKFYEEHNRNYENGVKVVYEIINKDTIYIHSIISKLKMEGNGTKALKSFLEEFNNKDVYIYSSNELGTGLKILNNWYAKLGFNECYNDEMPYNTTHCKSRLK